MGGRYARQRTRDWRLTVRTAVGADEPPRRPEDGYTLRQSNTTAAVDALVAWMDAEGVTVTPWQSMVVHGAYANLPPDPYRTVAVVERRRAIGR